MRIRNHAYNFIDFQAFLDFVCIITDSYICNNLTQMKIFRSDQIREIDNFTINHEPIASVELMERAAGQLFRWYVSRFERNRRIFIFAGPGNNGGDGLALARMLSEERYDVELHYLKFTDKTS